MSSFDSPTRQPTMAYGRSDVRQGSSDAVAQVLVHAPLNNTEKGVAVSLIRPLQSGSGTQCI